MNRRARRLKCTRQFSVMVAINKQWDPAFSERGPAFRDLRPASEYFAAHQDWPLLADYQSLLTELTPGLQSAGGAPLVFTDSAGAHGDGAGLSYEANIFRHGQVSTRTQCWHDFFQVLVWATFPRTKLWLNARHANATEQRLVDGFSQRGPEENALTLFDESGAVILCSDPEMLASIRAFNWHELFWRRRAELHAALRCIVVGHALYEKLLHPYIGLTAHCTLVAVPPAQWPQIEHAPMTELDAVVLAHLSSIDELQPRLWNPFPILGLPGWWPANNEESFYKISTYFRAGRRQRHEP